MCVCVREREREREYQSLCTKFWILPSSVKCRVDGWKVRDGSANTAACTSLNNWVVLFFSWTPSLTL